MRRGEIWWADLPPTAGKRPVLILTRDSIIKSRTSITVAPITRTIRRIPVEVPLDEEDGMPVKCIVNLDDIITIRKTRLTERITMLSREKMSDVAKAIVFSLDLHL
jgi:mRNA interferase MazF